jgi:hypothetical protein
MPVMRPPPGEAVVSNSQTRDINNSSVMISDLQIAINPSLNSINQGPSKNTGPVRTVKPSLKEIG